MAWARRQSILQQVVEHGVKIHEVPAVPVGALPGMLQSNYKIFASAWTPWTQSVISLHLSNLAA